VLDVIATDKLKAWSFDPFLESGALALLVQHSDDVRGV
jgi:hypothetical protein